MNCLIYKKLLKAERTGQMIIGELLAESMREREPPFIYQICHPQPRQLSGSGKNGLPRIYLNEAALRSHVVRIQKEKLHLALDPAQEASVYNLCHNSLYSLFLGVLTCKNLPLNQNAMSGLQISLNLPPEKIVKVNYLLAQPVERSSSRLTNAWNAIKTALKLHHKTIQIPATHQSSSWLSFKMVNHTGIFYGIPDRCLRQHTLIV